MKPEDQFTTWRSEYESDIIVSLASLAGERMFFDGDISSGVSGDLESATTVATLMEGYWGMGETVASHGVTQPAGHRRRRAPGGGERRRPGRPAQGQPRRAHRGQPGRAAERAEELLPENRAEVLLLAHALETHKTIAGEDVIAVHRGPARARSSTAASTPTTPSSRRWRRSTPPWSRPTRRTRRWRSRCPPATHRRRAAADARRRRRSPVGVLVEDPRPRRPLHPARSGTASPGTLSPARRGRNGDDGRAVRA